MEGHIITSVRTIRRHRTALRRAWEESIDIVKFLNGMNAPESLVDEFIVLSRQLQLEYLFLECVSIVKH